MLFRTCVLAVALMLPHAVTAYAVTAQETDERWYEGHVSASAGVSVFQRGGSGVMGIYALRMDMPVWPSLLLDGGVSYARRGSDSVIGDIFIPGLQIQLQGPLGSAFPYVGLGAGMTMESRKDDAPDDLSFSPSFAVGIRAPLSDGAGLRIEGRLNGVGANFRGVYTEMTAGLSVAW